MTTITTTTTTTKTTTIANTRLQYQHRNFVLFMYLCLLLRPLDKLPKRSPLGNVKVCCLQQYFVRVHNFRKVCASMRAFSFSLSLHLPVCLSIYFSFFLPLSLSLSLCVYLYQCLHSFSKRELLEIHSLWARISERIEFEFEFCSCSFSFSCSSSSS